MPDPLTETEADVVTHALLALFIDMDRKGPMNYLDDAGIENKEDWLAAFSNLRGRFDVPL